MNNKNKKIPLISIISCCYNVAEYIPDFMSSLLSQTYENKGKNITAANSKDIEIIMVEDCSTDDGETIKILNKYAKKYSNIKIIKMKNNQGLSAARNEGIKKASGKYIAFPDPDDLMNEGIIDVYIKTIKEKKYDVVCAGVIERHYDSKSRLQLEKEIKLKNASFATKKDVAKESINLENKICFGYAWNKLYKSSIIKNNKLKFIKDLKFIEDILFNVEFFKHCETLKTISLPAVIYNRRLKSSESITSHFEPKYFELHYLRIEYLYNYWKKFKVLNKNAKEILAKFYFRYSLSAIWRNTDKLSGLTRKQQKQWINNFYDLELTKLLLPYAKSDSIINNISIKFFKQNSISSLIIEANFIKFVTNNMGKVLIKLRQKR